MIALISVCMSPVELSFHYAPEQGRGVARQVGVACRHGHHYLIR